MSTALISGGPPPARGSSGWGPCQGGGVNSSRSAQITPQIRTFDDVMVYP
ncbi:hypothetical protein HMPREF0290_0416 [Corynebacterium efficiens YS-314]|nr:hypothetical protein HMPREF0290_0416 [Corynebacterium efficiens YS-314]